MERRKFLGIGLMAPFIGKALMSLFGEKQKESEGWFDTMKDHNYRLVYDPVYDNGEVSIGSVIVYKYIFDEKGELKFEVLEEHNCHSKGEVESYEKKYDLQDTEWHAGYGRLLVKEKDHDGVQARQFAEYYTGKLY